ncbi:hypothetical protein S40288_00847 [Stachybotrys chartarum IBT 40288]|nr:hypothetical protein S40288_00847 [Stachybotrys chartarum IBT 40288]
MNTRFGDGTIFDYRLARYLWHGRYAARLKFGKFVSGHRIDRIGPRRWNGSALTLAVSGPNVGTNTWLSVYFSGTVGTAVYAARGAGIPSIAFSAPAKGRRRFPWNTTPVPNASQIYEGLAANLTDKITQSGKPYIPNNVYLNVDFPRVTSKCQDPGKYQWVLSRINPGIFFWPRCRMVWFKSTAY